MRRIWRIYQQLNFSFLGFYCANQWNTNHAVRHSPCLCWKYQSHGLSGVPIYPVIVIYLEFHYVSRLVWWVTLTFLWKQGTDIIPVMYKPLVNLQSGLPHCSPVV
jgi:hypothetical protein